MNDPARFLVSMMDMQDTGIGAASVNALNIYRYRVGSSDRTNSFPNCEAQLEPADTMSKLNDEWKVVPHKQYDGNYLFGEGSWELNTKINPSAQSCNASPGSYKIHVEFSNNGEMDIKQDGLG